MDIRKWEPIEKLPAIELDPVVKASLKYSSHPSISKIKKIYGNHDKFEFKLVTCDDIYKYIMKLDKTKKTSGVITTSSLQETVDVCCDYVTNSVNNSITSCIIHDSLKYADVTPCHKKGRELDKGNYRPISLLPVVSKVLERVMYDQMDSFLQSKYLPLLCGSRKEYSTQHAILNLL